MDSTSAVRDAGAAMAGAVPMLAGRRVLVTGGSRGIGEAVVRTAHREGAEVVLHYGGSREAAQLIAAELDERVILVQGDLAEPGGGRAVWERAIEKAGEIDVLVNNAGAWLASPLGESVNRADSGQDLATWHQGWERNIALNLQAPADLCRQAILHFRERGGGVIVNLASRSSHRGDDAEHLAYGAAKGGLLALTKGIARGFAKDGVLAYAVAPGWVATDLAADIGEDVLMGLPLGEVTPPTDVAETVVFLASGRARHATGATVDITGADYVR